MYIFSKKNKEGIRIISKFLRRILKNRDKKEGGVQSVDDPLEIDTLNPKNFFEDRLNLSMEELVLSAILYKDFIELHRERFEFDSPLETKWKKLFPIVGPNVTHDRERVAIRPNIYAEAVFPFYDRSEKAETIVEDINPWRVIGGQYRARDYSDYVLDRLNAVFDENQYSPEKATYYRLDPFGVYIAVEGKNRVKWFRLKNRLIRAEVTIYRYFEPESMEILLFKKAGIYYIKNEKLGAEKIIPFPHLTVPILRRYGVRFTAIGGKLSRKEGKRILKDAREKIIRNTMLS